MIEGMITGFLFIKMVRGSRITMIAGSNSGKDILHACNHVI